MKKREEKYDIFISYRRDGGEFTAKILRDRLQARGYRVFFDVETLRSGDFNTKLYDVIDHCHDFLLVLSPGALDRCVNEGDWVRYEVERALMMEKNIVPIILRGFDFPDVLPESLEPVRYKSGVTASSQFFDAFIKTLCKYLTSPRPARTRPWVAALAAAGCLAAVLAAVFLPRLWSGSFPRTSTEKSVTDEVIYYVESNLTYIDMMSDAAGDALDSARRYLTTGSGAFSALDAAFDTALETIGSCELDRCAPSADFLQRVGALRDTPFSTADLIGMHDVAVSTQEQWLGNLSFLLWSVDPDSYLTADMRLAILENMQSFLEQDCLLNAYNANELLLPVTKRSALESFFQEYLPGLQSIPLSAADWNTDLQALQAAEETGKNQQEELVRERSAMVGNMTMDNAALRESLIRTYETAGLTREEAEQTVELWLQMMGLREQLDDVVAQLRPQPEDDWEVLWLKLQGLVSAGEYGYALECVDVLDTLMAGDADAACYLPALRLFLQSVEDTGVDYGVMVMAWYEPDRPNEQYQLGDVIIAVNGQTCRVVDEFTALRDQVDGAYTVTVLRANDEGRLEPMELQMDKDMPRVYLMDLTV